MKIRIAVGGRAGCGAKFVSRGGGGDSERLGTDDPRLGVKFCSIGKGMCSFSSGCHDRCGGVERNAM